MLLLLTTTKVANPSGGSWWITWSLYKLMAQISQTGRSICLYDSMIKRCTMSMRLKLIQHLFSKPSWINKPLIYKMAIIQPSWINNFNQVEIVILLLQANNKPDQMAIILPLDYWPHQCFKCNHGFTSRRCIWALYTRLEMNATISNHWQKCKRGCSWFNNWQDWQNTNPTTDDIIILHS